MKKIGIIAFLVIGHLNLSAQANVDSWMINTTNDMYGGMLTDVEEIWYNSSFLYVKASGVPSYFAPYAGESLFQPTDQSYVIKIPREPVKETGTNTEMFTGAVGFGIDGSPIFHTGDGKSWNGSNFATSGDGIWNSLAWEYEGNDMDASNGHSTAMSVYHHHVGNFDLFDETDASQHSPIIGWAFDGYPIYGSYGYSDSMDNSSSIVRIETSYQTRNITDRTTLPDGTVLTDPNDYGPTIGGMHTLGKCVEDYEYVEGLGHLDIHNGRWCVTPEFPCGTYAYFATIDATLAPVYPYHVGDTYYGVVSIATSTAGSSANIPSGASLFVAGDDLCNVSVSTNATDPSACGSADGTISTTVSGFGDLPCYSWSSGGVSSVETNLGAGTYTITVTGNSCSKSEIVTLSGGSSPSYSSVLGNPSCSSSDGTISLTASGGDGGPYTYSIDGGATSQTNSVFSGLSSGNYSIFIEDGSGCSITGTESLTTASGPSISSSTTSDPSCNGNTDGVISILASGGTGALTYSIDNGVSFQSASTFSNLSSGTFSIVVEDGAGCQTSSSISLSNPTSVTFTSVSSDIGCNGDTDGSISLSGSGGTGSLNYSVDNGTSTQSSGSFSGLSAATYLIIVQDDNACQATGSITVTEPTAITASDSGTDISCNGENDGMITINASGGTGSLSFSIDNGITNQSSNIFTGLFSGSYDIVVVDQNECSVSNSITLIEPTVISFSTIISDATCGNADGSVTISAAGGSGAYAYSADNGVTFQTSNNFSSLSSGTYEIVVEDANGCQMTSSESLSNTGGPVISLIEPQQPCNGGSDGSITITATGSNLQFSIDGGVTFQTSNVFSGLSSGPIQVVVQDASGCQTVQNTGLMGPPMINISGNESDEINGNDGSINLTATGGGGTLSYSWSNGSTTEDINGLSAGTYTVTVTDDEGCSQEASFTISSQVGVVEFSASDVNIYPNPTQGTLNVSSTYEILSVRLFSSLGQQVKCNFHNGIIELENLPRGTYHLQIKNEDGQSVYCKITKI